MNSFIKMEMNTLYGFINDFFFEWKSNYLKLF